MNTLKEKVKYYLSYYRKEVIIFTTILIFVIISVIIFVVFNKNNVMNVSADSGLENIEIEDNILKGEQSGNDTLKDQNIITNMVFVEIKGQVKKPGVYEVSEDSRINDVIKKAGGLTSIEDISVNNLARKVKDEMVIIIYSKSEVQNFITTKYNEKEKYEETTVIKDAIKNDSIIKAEEIDTNNNNNEVGDVNDNEETKKNNKISINTGTKEELMTLSGIGETKANAIIEYREKNGSFSSLEDIMNVSGIGQSSYEKIKDDITL